MSAISNLIGGLGPVGIAAAAVGAAVVGIGVASVKMAATFQSGLEQLVTGAGESQANLQMIGNGIKQVSVDTATSTDDLVKAMFSIDSAGYTGARGLTILKVAAQGAKVGNADLTQTTDVLMTAMHNYNLSADQAVPTMNSLIVAVKNGRMHMDQLSAAMTNVLPVSAALKVHLSDVEGALSTMANAGDRGAGAGTHLAMMLKMLSNPAKSAASEMTSMGIDSIKLAQTMSTSLPAALEMIQNAVAKHFVPGSVQYNRAISAILGGSKSGIAGLEIMGANFKTLKSNSDAAAGAMSHAGKSVQGFSDIQNTLNFKMGQAKMAFDAMLISIGQQLLPVVTQFAQQMTPMIQQFSDWLTKSGALKIAASFLASALQNLLAIVVGLAIELTSIVTFFQKNEWAMDALKAVLIAFAIVVAPMVVAALISMAVSAWLFLAPILVAAAPFIALGLVIAAVIFGIIEAYKHWGAIMDWISGKTEQTNLKIQISDSQAAVKKDQQQKKSAQDTLKNLEKEKTDILNKLKTTKDAATKLELQQQLEMTQRQIDGQNDRIKAADKDAALQKTKQKKLHDDLIESQKDLGTRMDDAVGKWYNDQNTKVTQWFNSWSGNLSKWYNDQNKTVTKWFDSWSGFLSRWVADSLGKVGRMKDQFIWTIISWKNQALEKIDTFVTQIKTTFSNLPAQAVQWGSDLIQNLINGINGMLGSLSGAVGNVASTISSMLHFTRPDKGPLKTVDEWMPHLGDTLILGLNNISPKLQAAAMRAAAAVAGPIKGSTDGAMPSHIFDFIGSNYSGYASGMATTAKREQAADTKAAKQAAALAKQEAGVESHIQKLEQHYHVTVNTHGKGKWTKADATELAKLLAEQTRLQGKSPQTASGRRG